MRNTWWRNMWWLVAWLIYLPLLAASQEKIQRFAVSGSTGTIPVVQINGKNYVEVNALAQLVSGSLSFRGTQMTLTLGGSATAPPPEKVGLSRDFLRAAIKELSTIRE